MKRIYISGGITNVSDFMNKFNEAENELLDMGYTSIVNPAFVNSHLPKDFTPSKNDKRIRFCSGECQLSQRKENNYMKNYYKENKDILSQKKKEQYSKRNNSRNTRYATDENYRNYCIERTREYNKKYPEKKLDNHLSKYGMTYTDYLKLYEKQNKKCAICGSLGDLSKPNRPLYVDHNHKTGEVRGLLCQNCNFMIGQANESIEILESGIQYLKGCNNDI